MMTAAATKASCLSVINHLGGSNTGSGARDTLSGPFEPIASIVARCEEKTGAMMRPRCEHA